MPYKINPFTSKFDDIGNLGNYSIGTSGGTIPLLNANNTWSGTNTFTSSVIITTPSGSLTSQGNMQLADNYQFFIGDGSGQLGNAYFIMDGINGYMITDLSQIESLSSSYGWVIQGGSVAINPAGSIFIGTPSLQVGPITTGTALSIRNSLYVGRNVDNTSSSSSVAANIGIDYAYLTNTANQFNAANQTARFNSSANLTSSSVAGISAGRNILRFGTSGTGTISLASSMSTNITGAASTATLVTDGFEYYGEPSSIAGAQFTRGGKIFLKNWAAPTGSGSVGSLYGVRIEALTRGTRNYEIALEDGGGVWFRVPTSTTAATERIYSSAASTLDDDANTTRNFRIATTIELALTAGALTAKDAFNYSFGTGTGTKLGTSTTQKIGFWNTTPIVQPTTGVTAATFVANTSGIANDTATFDGYTIGQVVKALRNTGLLA